LALHLASLYIPSLLLHISLRYKDTATMAGILDTTFIPSVYSPDGAPEGAQPILQCLTVKKINANAGNAAADRYP